MIPELIQKLHDVRELTRNGKLCFDCAGASGSRVGPSRKIKKRKHFRWTSSRHRWTVGFENISGTILESIVKFLRAYNEA